MKMDCEIIQDLMPLMADDVCSEKSKQAVEAHIEECEECGRLYRTMVHPQIKPEPPVVNESRKKERIMKIGMKKIIRNWILSLLAIAILIPTAFLAQNQIYGHGMAFTNIRERMIADTMLKNLAAGDYQQAFQQIDAEGIRNQWISRGLDVANQEDFAMTAESIFCKSSEMLEAAGGIQDVQYQSITRQENCYWVSYKVKSEGKWKNMEVEVNNHGVTDLLSEGAYKEEPLPYFCTWREWLYEYYYKK